jgi:dCMP deaminase
MTWEEYAMALAEVASLKSKDPWVKVGCCLLRTEDNTAILGFNGFPKGVAEDWTDRVRRRKFVVHAEQNALRYIKPNECYLCAVTLLCCNDCLKSLASYGIKKIVYREIYEHDPSTLEYAKDFGIELIKL